MRTTFAVIITAAFAGPAAAQTYVSPPQAVPGTPFQPGQVTPAGAFTQGGVVTGQPYYLTPSVMGSNTNGTVVGSPYPAVSTGNTVVGGSYLANGTTTQPGVTTYTPGYQAGTVYPQPYTMSRTVYSASPYAMNGTIVTQPYTTYSTSTYTANRVYGPAGTAGSGLFATPVRVVNTVVGTPVRVGRRIFRR